MSDPIQRIEDVTSLFSAREEHPPIPGGQAQRAVAGAFIELLQAVIHAQSIAMAVARQLDEEFLARGQKRGSEEAQSGPERPVSSLRTR